METARCGLAAPHSPALPASRVTGETGPPRRQPGALQHASSSHLSRPYPALPKVWQLVPGYCPSGHWGACL